MVENEYSRLIDFLCKIEAWDNDEMFLRDAIIMSSAKLLVKCHEEVNQSNVVIIAPLLRQVQENIIVVLGLQEEVLTAEKFINDKHKPSNTMEQKKKKRLENEENKFDCVNNYLKVIKEILNKYSHTNFEGVMILFTERFQIYEAQQFSKITMKFIISLIETPFFAIVNHIYKLNMKLLKVEKLQKELKELGTLKYITRYFPDSIKEFINQSEVLKKYYLNAMADFKKIFQEYKEIKSVKL